MYVYSTHLLQTILLYARERYSVLQAKQTRVSLKLNNLNVNVITIIKSVLERGKSFWQCYDLWNDNEQCQKT